MPDTMNVFGIYDTDCSTKTFDSMEARSQYQREQSKVGNNKNFLSADSTTKSDSTSKNGGYNTLFYDISGSKSDSNHFNKENQRASSTSTVEGRGSEGLSKSKSVKRIFEFTCRIRRYDIFMDEVTPSQLSEAFLKDFMSLPVSFQDFRNLAHQKYFRFLERWGTHYIKSASFGGKFTLLRESTISGTETKDEWEAKMLKSVDETMSSGSSSSESSSWAAKGSAGLFGLGYKVDTSGNKQEGKTEGTKEQESDKKGESASTSDAAREENQMTKDEIIVEGGHQQVAAILSDKNRAGFKAEFKDWLDSIPDYPKGYDFNSENCLSY